MAAKKKPNGKNNGKGNGVAVVKPPAKQEQSKSAGQWQPGQSGNPETKWQPGQSGNPNGRATNPHSLTAAFREVLGWKISGKIPDSFRQIFPDMPQDPRLELCFAARAAIKALDIKTGDVMMNVIWERLDGKVPFPISGPDDGPIPFKLDLSNLPINDLQQLRKILNKVKEEV